jgi:hypothetical protein
MKEIQILHKGKVFHGRIGFEIDIMEIQLTSTAPFACGDKLLRFDFQNRQPVIVLCVTDSKIIVAPADAEIFKVEARPKVYDDLFGEEQQSVKGYKLNTFATITDDFRTRAVRVTDISRLGIGFEIDDFTVKMNELYETTMFCDDEAVRLQLIVRYAHIMEKTIRYGCEIHHISTPNLNNLRYFVMMQQFKKLMLV